ncbi:MAG: HzsA-related protein [Planctomycetota bacterium]
MIRPHTFLLIPVVAFAFEASTASAAERPLDAPFVVTQVPAARRPIDTAPWEAGVLRADYGGGARIALVQPDGKVEVLTGDFHSAADPDVSFDGRRLLFAGKPRASDDWNIYELELDGGATRQITTGLADCRQPVYQGTLYTIVSTEPWHQITFVSTAAQERNEHGALVSTSLYSCRQDGSEVQRLTYNPSADLDPAVLPDGRLVFSSWQRSTLQRGSRGRISLFTAHTDGLDYALFSGDEGLEVKLMPAVTSDRLVIFVEGNQVAADGSGGLASVSLRRNLHSYRRITRDDDGLFHSPSALADGSILVSRRPRGNAGTHGVFRMDPATGRTEPVFDDPQHDDVQTQTVRQRPVPDGRSSVVKPANPIGTLYCLDVYESDRPNGDWITPGTPLRLRVLEGIPRQETKSVPLLQRRFVGEIDVEPDGSFNLEVPPNIPLELQLVDADGMALRSCSWIWVRNNETRGCIGCHEDGERTPENRFVDALRKPPMRLTLAPDRRRTVELGRDVAPIVAARCAGCHQSPEYLLDGVNAGRARTSPLAWRLAGRITARPWDPDVAPAGDPGTWTQCGASLSESERRTILEWIDLGAQGETR